MTEMSGEFLSALSADPSATMRFSGLPEEEKEQILQNAKRAHSAQEIEHIVSRI